MPVAKRFKNTQFGARALLQARDQGFGSIVNPDGSLSSVRTMTVDIEGPRGRTDVMILPTIRLNPSTGRLEVLPPDRAIQTALQMRDFVVVKGGKTQKKIERARKKSDKKSKKFSKKLGRIGDRARRKAAKNE